MFPASQIARLALFPILFSMAAVAAEPVEVIGVNHFGHIVADLDIKRTK